MSPVPQSGGAGSRHVGFGGAERRGGDGSDQRLLPLLPQGQLLYTKGKLVNTLMDVCTRLLPSYMYCECVRKFHTCSMFYLLIILTLGLHKYDWTSSHFQYSHIHYTVTFEMMNLTSFSFILLSVHECIKLLSPSLQQKCAQLNASINQNRLMTWTYASVACNRWKDLIPSVNNEDYITLACVACTEESIECTCNWDYEAAQG